MVQSFPFGMPDGTQKTRRIPTFNTLAREHAFRNPSKEGSTYTILNEFVAPHLESFNSLFDDSGLPSGDGDGRGLLSLALKDIGERVAFDGDGKVGSESGPDGWGNRMRSKLTISKCFMTTYTVLEYGLSKLPLRDQWSLRKTGPRRKEKSFHLR